ncbi:MAG: Asp/Glu/hydantoin racemase [Proteobacteria bacterium]|nr:Asp/Glu/hydantoin racemase [Pseudomonadota bacterium]
MGDPSEHYQRPLKYLATVTPSGNTVVERVTLAILAQVPGVSPHFSRSAVFGARDPFPDSYDWDSMLGAARLLGHARPDLIVWNGSKGGSVGIEVERELVKRLAEAAGCPATTSLFATIEVLERTGARQLGFVTPYVDAYQAKVEKNFAALGFETVVRENARIADNLAYASVPMETILDMARRAADARPDALLGWCTNFPTACVAARIEAETGIPFYDATSIILWKALRLLGLETSHIADWGRVFALD